MHIYIYIYIIYIYVCIYEISFLLSKHLDECLFFFPPPWVPVVVSYYADEGNHMLG